MSLFQAPVDCSKGSDCKWHHCYFHIPQLFFQLARILSTFSPCANFSQWFLSTAKSTIWEVLFSLWIKTRSGIIFFFYSFKVFHISTSWWFFTASLLKSPGIFLVFWPFSIMPTILQILFFLLLIIIRSGLLAEIRWSVGMSKSHRSFRVSFSRTGAGLCIYHLLTWSTWISCIFPSGSPCRSSHVSSYIPSVLICCIRLLCDWSFRLCHRIPLTIFHTGVSWWFSIGVWVTASLLKSQVF